MPARSFASFPAGSAHAYASPLDRTNRRLGIRGEPFRSRGMRPDGTNRFPIDPSRFIVPVAAGGPTDIVARIVAEGLSDVGPAGYRRE